MLYEDLFNSFIGSYKEGDIKSAMNSLMRELGNALVRNRQQFIDLLNESEIPASVDMTDTSLVDLFIENVDKKPQLALGASMLVNMNNSVLNADGEDEISDYGVKAGYNTIKSYFFDEENSNAVGALIAGAVAPVAGLTKTIAEGQQKKKYGTTEALQKKQEARAALTQQIIAQRQAQLEAATKQKEASAKTTRTLLIVGGAVVLLGIIGFMVYKLKK